MRKMMNKQNDGTAGTAEQKKSTVRFRSYQILALKMLQGAYSNLEERTKSAVAVQQYRTARSKHVPSDEIE